ncbi:DUF6338 family protein [Micromonospora sp. NPDC049274]|uniref:DUF6338 family protein n=1 Tax=Micromonospora sp. NPDC049274 TaxID=3154829 RepID=UPI00343025C8
MTMPTTVVGVVFVLVIFLPALAFSTVRSLRFPEIATSQLRELSRAVTIGFVCDVAALGGFVLVRLIAPRSTPDVTAWVVQGGAYARSHFATIAGWSLGLLILAVVIAALAALVVPRGITNLGPDSSWWRLFEEYRRQSGAYTVRVECELVNGASVVGTLMHFSHDPRETPDRELALGQPLSYRRPGDRGPRDILDHDVIAVSARQIVFFSVTYVAKEADEPADDSDAGSATSQPAHSAG